MDKETKQKIKENILFIQSVFHELGCNAEIKGIDKLTKEELDLLESI